MSVKASKDTAPAIVAEAAEEPSRQPTAETPEAERDAPVAAARARAASLLSEGRYAEARQALEEADSLESGKGAALHQAKQVWNNLSARVRKAAAPTESQNPLEASIGTVGRYSKIGAALGLLPGGLLNFGAVLVLQVAMVWKIARHYGAKDGKERIRGSILSLIGAAVPTSLGHGVTYAVAAIPALVLGNLLYFVVTPVLAYAMTQAVGKAFVMHFESGGTLLTFDPKAFQAFFLEEFKKSGGTVTAA
jgi:uncharacterized protein (DUF697 family)